MSDLLLTASVHKGGGGGHYKLLVLLPPPVFYINTEDGAGQALALVVSWSP